MLGMDKEMKAALQKASTAIRAENVQGSPRLVAARFFVQVFGSRMAERALAQETLSVGKSVEVRWAFASTSVPVM